MNPQNFPKELFERLSGQSGHRSTFCGAFAKVRDSSKMAYLRCCTSAALLQRMTLHTRSDSFTPPLPSRPLFSTFDHRSLAFWYAPRTQAICLKHLTLSTVKNVFAWCLWLAKAEPKRVTREDLRKSESFVSDSQQNPACLLKSGKTSTSYRHSSIL